jgi:hypothetical protein
VDGGGEDGTPSDTVAARGGVAQALSAAANTTDNRSLKFLSLSPAKMPVANMEKCLRDISVMDIDADLIDLFTAVPSRSQVRATKQLMLILEKKSACARWGAWIDNTNAIRQKGQYSVVLARIQKLCMLQNM